MTGPVKPPFRRAFDASQSPLAARNALGITGTGGSGGGAPPGAEYIVAVDDPTLTNDRVLTNTATVTWDLATAGQVKANAVVPASGAPVGAQYITAATDPTLTNERVLTNTPTVTWDLATAGQAKANAVAGAPVGAEYITSTADATLTAERVLTDTASVTWDRTTAGQIKANAVGGAGSPAIGFRAVRTTDQAVSGGTTEKVFFPTEDYDRGGYYDPVTSVWTPPAGLVHMDVGLFVAAGATANGSCSAFIFKNGVMLKQGVLYTPTAAAGSQLSVDDVANGTDSYTVYISCSAAAPVNVYGYPPTTFFSGHVVSAQGVKGDTGATGPSGSVTGVVVSPQGRLTLTSGTPVMTANPPVASLVYYTPYVGNQISLFDGTNMVATTFAELGCATTDTTKNPAALGVGKVNDWFVWNDAGTIRLCHGPDWTNDTTRSAGTALVRVKGLWLNNASITNACAAQRGTYVGTTITGYAGAANPNWILGGAGGGGFSAYLGVWNAYNRVQVTARSSDTTDHAVSTAAIWTNAATPNTFIWFVSGLAEDVFRAEYQTLMFGHVAYACLGVAYDATSDPSGVIAYQPPNGGGTQTATFKSTALGAHIVRATEMSGAVSGCTYGGTGGIPLGAAGAVASGLTLEFMM